MATAATTQPVTQSSTGMTAAQFAYLLWQQQQAAAEAGSASDAARGLSQNYTDRANAQIKTGDAYYDMLMALKDQLISTPGQDEGDIVNRTNQIASGLNGTVDRAAAVAGSQAGAQLRKRGMGDSTQAAESANALTRQYGDVYQKIQEMARQRAFDEQKAKQGTNIQALSAVGSGLSSANNSNLTSAQQMASAASTAAAAARQNEGSKSQNLLESKLMSAMLGSKAVNGRLDKGLDYLGNKIENKLGSMFSDAAPAIQPTSEFDTTAYYSVTSDGKVLANWGSMDSSGQPSTLQSYRAQLPEYAIKDPVWFNQYPDITAAAAPAPAPQEQTSQKEDGQWYPLTDYSATPELGSGDFKYTSAPVENTNYFSNSALQAPQQQENIWERDWTEWA